MKGFKGFEPGLICRGKQYKENEVFEEESAVICESGMHFCKNPLDVLNYYDLFNSKGQMNEFATVEALDEVHTYDDKKFCTKKLRIGAKLSLSEFIKASIDVTQTTIREEVDKARLKAKKGGNSAKLAGGYSAKLAGGENAVMVGGHGSIAKGKKGSVIVLVATDNYGNIVNFKAEQVDGERIKEDTFYMLVDGEFQEVKG